MPGLRLGINYEYRLYLAVNSSLLVRADLCLAFGLGINYVCVKFLYTGMQTPVDRFPLGSGRLLSNQYARGTKMKLAITWCTVITLVCAGNYVIFTYVGLWTYIAISLGCGVIWMLFICYQQRKDHELQMVMARYAIKTEGTITDIRKKGF
jgi:hypothetical protein